MGDALVAAAAARMERAAGGGMELWHRPSQRRSAQEAASRSVVRAPARMEVRAADDGGTVRFEGVASATERGYEMWDWAGPYTEVVAAGAFEDTLNRADLDVPLVLAHDSLRRVARTLNGSLTLSETDEGLSVLAESLDLADADVAYIVPKIRAGLIDEMSFAFRIDKGQWSPEYTEYRIERVDIHRGDVAIVGYGANPHTTANVRSGQGRDVRAVRARLALAIA